MCNLTTQWAVPSNGPLNAGSVREINSRVSPSKNMINTPPGDAAEDEVGAAGSGSVGTQGEVGGGTGASAAEQRGQRVGHTGSKGKGRQGKGNLGHHRHRDPYLPSSPHACGFFFLLFFLFHRGLALKKSSATYLLYTLFVYLNTCTNPGFQ